MSFHQRLVGELAIELPGATAVFRRRKIDFCCNGRITLEAAATAKGISLDALVQELQALAPSAGAAPVETPALIEHILERYHDTHMREFPEAIRMAHRVEAVHRDHPECPRGLGDLLRLMFDELADHQQKEEAVLFPMMLSGQPATLTAPITRMMAEHEELGRQLEQVTELTDDFTPPQDACTTWRALYAATRKLDEDLREHMHLEGNVLFPRFGKA
jgi:regulator of cell morphogenesis and NO signaling